MTQQGLSTTAVHAGSERPNPHHSLTVPVTQTATYTFSDTQDLCDFMDARMWGMAKGRTEYGRYGNPTVAAAETKLAALEGAEAALLYSSGMAAVTSTILTLVNAGAHIIITDDSYRRTRQFCLNFLKKFNIESTVVPMGDFTALESAIRPETKLIISESPTNPYLRVLDLKHLADIAKAHNIKTLVDATFATPFNLRPLDFGIDLVIHSATKYLGGHNDILAGVVAGSEQLIALLRQQLWMLGGVFDPHSAYLLLRGLKTLGLRVERQNQNGQRIAEFLEAHPKIDRVWYPGLTSHPDHAVAAKQMKGFGGVISFEVRGGITEGSRVVDRVRIPIIAPSLGGVETLIEQPALMSYYEMSTEERLAVGIKDNLIRLALGVEDTEDLINDLAQALEQA
ncbi:MAG: aminotransferase class I/II-fold pyridoxal phosphate-dependent enzyme [Chloroflexi bacterium]|nr:aminotransferase class I/II-fold pyridoxal phosphate-dependent enzyme [Chloroflexota bacterium]MBI5712759.1 aminotransferase class I/II-fold pyridoxal phosphate-dependent enzyme [Chloroflexota bacterium]